MSRASKLAAAAIVALLALQWLWHAWLAPPQPPAWAVALFFSLPILPAAVLLLIGHRRAGFWGSLAALLYFSHGVMVAWSDPDVTGLAMAQILLSAVLVIAASWDGVRGRFAKRRDAPDV